VLSVDALLPAAQLQLRAFRLQLRNLVVHAFLMRYFFLSQHFFTWGKLRNSRFLRTKGTPYPVAPPSFYARG
jgi:hypothetical protein